jgi:hypothetical protein
MYTAVPIEPVGVVHVVTTRFKGVEDDLSNYSVPQAK